MSISNKLLQFLKRHKVYYQLQYHPETFTAARTAESEHVSGKCFLKPVMVKVGEKTAMVVLPSNRIVDLFKLSNVAGSKVVRIEEEREFQDLFPDCAIGAMPPFGRIYNLPSYVDESIQEASMVYFNAGNHNETVSISTEDFLRVSKAIIGDFSVIRHTIAA